MLFSIFAVPFCVKYGDKHFKFLPMVTMRGGTEHFTANGTLKVRKLFQEVPPFNANSAVEWGSDHFLPEIARRLGTSFFTKDLSLDHESVINFVEEPQQFLCDITRRLDSSSRAALGMIFMRGGKFQKQWAWTSNHSGLVVHNKRHSCPPEE
jgi:hypothetical protein